MNNSRDKSGDGNKKIFSTARSHAVPLVFNTQSNLKNPYSEPTSRHVPSVHSTNSSNRFNNKKI